MDPLFDVRQRTDDLQRVAAELRGARAIAAAATEARPVVSAVPDPCPPSGATGCDLEPRLASPRHAA